MKVRDKTLKLISAHYKADYCYADIKKAEAKCWELSPFKDQTEFEQHNAKKGLFDIDALKVRIGTKFNKNVNKAFYCVYL